MSNQIKSIIRNTIHEMIQQSMSDSNIRKLSDKHDKKSILFQCDIEF